MPHRLPLRTALACSCLALAVMPAWSQPPLVERPIEWSQAGQSLVDHSRFLDAPAGKDGFIRVQDGHFVRPDGSRFRIWGVNITGIDCFPTRDEAIELAGDLARLGVNCVRFHFFDTTWSGLFPREQGNTRSLSPDAMDRLDFLIATLRDRGIYSNLNLNVARSYLPGDGVRDSEILGFGKSATYFNPRLIELQREYARQFLTHHNPYTGHDHRDDPAVAFIELVNENSVLEGWVGGRLVGEDTENPSTWSPIPVSYAEELTDQFNAWLNSNVSPDELATIRQESGGAERIPRLKPDQFKASSALRFTSEARFYMHLERTFFEGMKSLIVDELKARPIVLGTADHNDGVSGYAHILSNMVFDAIDGHGYWEHPRTTKPPWIKNTPMVNDPLDSTVVQFARTPVLGMPYTISETNHPFPHEYASEGFPILTAYALLHDWDGIYWFSWKNGRKVPISEGIRSHFDFSNDPAKVTNVAACAPMWYRQDVAAARQTIVRAYTTEQIIESLRMPRNESKPFFTPGFARSTPLEHATRWTPAERASDPFPPAADLGRIVSDTGQLAWTGADQKQGLVRVETPATEALIGFVGGATRELPHLTASVQNPHCALILSSLDDQPIDQAARLLLVTNSKATNTGFRFEADHQTIASMGAGPTLIEPVVGTITLKGLSKAATVSVQPLGPEGSPLGQPRAAQQTDSGWSIEIGEPAATWSLITITR